MARPAFDAGGEAHNVRMRGAFQQISNLIRYCIRFLDRLIRGLRILREWLPAILIRACKFRAECCGSCLRDQGGALGEIGLHGMLQHAAAMRGTPRELQISC